MANALLAHAGVVLQPEEMSRLVNYDPDLGGGGKWSYGSGLALAFHVGDLVQVLSGESLMQPGIPVVTYSCQIHTHTTTRYIQLQNFYVCVFCSSFGP